MRWPELLMHKAEASGTHGGTEASTPWWGDAPEWLADFRNAAIESNISEDNAVPLPSRTQRSPRLNILSCRHLKDLRLGGSTSPAHPGQHPWCSLEIRSGHKGARLRQAYCAAGTRPPIYSTNPVPTDSVRSGGTLLCSALHSPALIPLAGNRH